MCWDASTRRARLWRRQSRRREGLWKRRGLEKSKSRLSHPAWKSRKLRGIPTFPQPRRRQVKLLNRTFHVLQKADILTCYGHREDILRVLSLRVRRALNRGGRKEQPRRTQRRSRTQSFA